MAYSILDFVNMKTAVEIDAAARKADTNVKPLLDAEAAVREYLKIGENEKISPNSEETLPPELDIVMEELKNYVKNI